MHRRGVHGPGAHRPTDEEARRDGSAEVQAGPLPRNRFKSSATASGPPRSRRAGEALGSIVRLAEIRDERTRLGRPAFGQRLDLL